MFAVLALIFVGFLLLTVGIFFLYFDITVLPAILEGCVPFGSSNCFAPTGPSGSPILPLTWNSMIFLIGYPLTALGIACIGMGLRKNKTRRIWNLPPAIVVAVVVFLAWFTH